MKKKHFNGARIGEPARVTTLAGTSFVGLVEHVVGNDYYIRPQGSDNLVVCSLTTNIIEPTNS